MSGIASDGAAAVRQATQSSSEVRKTMDSLRSDPRGQTGLSEEELRLRRAEASAPRKFTTPEGKLMDVKSSTKAQQVMSRGVVAAQQRQRREAFAQKADVLRKARWVVPCIALCFVGYVAVEFLLPQYARVQERNWRMQVRHERAEKRFAEIARQREGDAQPSQQQ